MTRVVVGLALIGVAGVVVLCNAAILIVSIPDPIGLLLAGIAAVLPAAGFLLLVLRLDRFEREPLSVVAAAFFWGAGGAALFAWVVNSTGLLLLDVTFGAAAAEIVGVSMMAPVIEESIKGLALLILLVFVRKEFDNLIDGILYGSVVGLGFAMTENIAYFGEAYLEGGLLGLGVLFYLRIMLSGLAHAIFTASFGAAVGYFRESRRQIRYLVLPIGFLLAIAQHALWNLIPGTMVPALVGDDPAGAMMLVLILFPVSALIFLGPGLIGLLGLVVWGTRKEARSIREHLRPEFESGLLTAEEYRLTSAAFGRAAGEFGILFRDGLGAWRRRRRLHALATDLAFNKWHQSRGDPTGNAETQQGYRDRISALRASG